MPTERRTLTIKRALTAAGFPGCRVSEGTGSVRGNVAVYFMSAARPFESDALYTARMQGSAFLRATFPDVTWSGEVFSDEVRARMVEVNGSIPGLDVCGRWVA